MPGTRVFCELDGDAAPEDFGGLAALSRTVADAFGADRALGVSLGAGGLLRLLAQDPDRLARVVLFQPSTLQVVSAARRRQTTTFLELAQSGDLAALTSMLNDELPVDVRDARQSVAASALRAERLSRPEGLRLLKNLAAGDPPVFDPAALSAVSAQVLVVAAAGDPVHPVGVAEEIAGLIPGAVLKVFAQPAPLWHARAELRALISGFLAG